jgi:hypothetical protein
LVVVNEGEVDVEHAEPFVDSVDPFTRLIDCGSPRQLVLLVWVFAHPQTLD